MKTHDFRNCYVFSTSGDESGVLLNTCRSQILSHCEIINQETGEQEEFFLAKECIGEHCYPEGGIAQIPTAEVCIIFTRGGFKLIKKFADHKTDIIQIKRLGEKAASFTGQQFHLKSLDFHLKLVEGYSLETRDEIIKSTLESDPIVARTTLWDAKKRWRAVIEYPVVYMNVHTQRRKFQIDVGPVLFPDCISKKSSAPFIACMELAYIMYQEFDRAEFAVRAPTSLGEGNGLETLHYSKVIHTSAKNELFRLKV
ncbi:MAG: hypothetical protein NT011_13740 [Kiritimatiellaeota bacterium]|nr:hypothetical protein [Kiritimatiellota bacterium]